ncbi:MAG: ribosomal-processing cysteine protease Prp [Lachnospiraceae bacterium]|nr:ribosomal-processing cysteine protease Prp [Lachnospiraceae bacterium]
MITVTISRSGEEITGFEVRGHALFDKPGKDVVCAAVSILTINTVNSVEAFLPEELAEVVSDREAGLIRFRFKGRPSEKAGLLMDSYLLGLRGIEEKHGKYLKVKEIYLA